jgi:hypothetical protein
MRADSPISTHDAIEVLAPGAGGGIGRKIAERLLSRPDWLDLMETALVNALSAQMRYYDNATKKHVVMQDAKTQLNAVLGIWSHLEGDPIKRVIHQHFDRAGVDGNLSNLLAESPQLREELAKELAKASSAPRRSVEVIDLD